MNKLIDIPTFSDERGSLSIIEEIIPFKIKRIYYIYDIIGKRGGHRHIKTRQALICLSGSCEIYINNGFEKKTFILNKSNKCLLVEPEDWHTMDSFTEGSVLLVLASEKYDKLDYIEKGYN